MSDAVPPRRPFGYAKSKPRQAEHDFEVVDEAPPFEVVDETPKKAPKKPARAEALELEEDERESKPKKKKKRSFKPKPTFVDEDQASRDSALRHYEWTIPSVLLGIGMVMTFVCAIGALKGAGVGVVTFVFLCLGILISIPLTIAVLMVVGMLCGIEYGRLGPAILKIAAIAFVANGIMFLGAWLKLPGFIVFPISCFITFGLFMSQFDLDTWETNASVGALNVLAFASKWLIIFLLIGMANRADKNRPAPEDDDPPDIQEKLNERSKDRGDKLPGPANPGNPPRMDDDE
jgi:hypothetical protein